MHAEPSEDPLGNQMPCLESSKEEVEIVKTACSPEQAACGAVRLVLLAVEFDAKESRPHDGHDNKKQVNFSDRVEMGPQIPELSHLH